MSKPVADTFRENLRLAMRERGINMTDLARQAGMSRPSISNILSGKEQVTLPRAERIASVVGYTLSYLISVDSSDLLSERASQVA